MDSLFANYASSDDEEDAQACHPPPSPNRSSAFFSALPSPKSSSLFSLLPPLKSSASPLPSLPPPKFQLGNPSLPTAVNEGGEGREPTRKSPSSAVFSALPPPKNSSSSIFTSLPPPKSRHEITSNRPPAEQNPKRVVQFTIPLKSSMLKSQDFDDDDDDEEGKGSKPRKDASFSSAHKALSSMLPAPKNLLCLAPAQSLGASRRESLQADVPSADPPRCTETEQVVGEFTSYAGINEEQGRAASSGTYSSERGISGYENYANYDANVTGYLDSTYASNPAATRWEHGYGKDMGYENYTAHWPDDFVDGTTSEVPEIGRISGKRGRNNVPTEILEVKQDELMKNRPREDQVKLTGIAFGPSYQDVQQHPGAPLARQSSIYSLTFEELQSMMGDLDKNFGSMSMDEFLKNIWTAEETQAMANSVRSSVGSEGAPAASSKGKPSKLHKRKHQIGSLYFDMKQKEMELAERRSRGLLTKAETQAKYGW
ncbi:Abscisic acid-insensitive 5-like protein 4 [Apostasia shenzhenica]|uniref:Abscisic acid-insensitive 5-like protein 4 n=1 Tax=Apostasia shenzhenica TaxID=1088818 RepID=A0A2I0B833_9ASPA|nr:Abscisic acid-insensitive 5-like protein 4 [Apostasia shenzhenica]